MMFTWVPGEAQVVHEGSGGIRTNQQHAAVRWGGPSTGFSTAAGNTFGQVGGTTGSQRLVRFGGRFVF